MNPLAFYCLFIGCNSPHAIAPSSTQWCDKYSDSQHRTNCPPDLSQPVGLYNFIISYHHHKCFLSLWRISSTWIRVICPTDTYYFTTISLELPLIGYQSSFLYKAYSKMGVWSSLVQQEFCIWSITYLVSTSYLCTSVAAESFCSFHLKKRHSL